MKHLVLTQFECSSRQSACALEQQVCWKLGSSTL